MSKVYKNASELKAHLINDRNVTVGDEYSDIFTSLRYKNVVDAYKDIIGVFRNGIYEYPLNTTIEDFLFFVTADKWVSQKLFSYIDSYENQLKLFVSEKICLSMVKAGSLDCCDYTLFSRILTEYEPPLDCFIPFQQRYVKKSNKSDFVVSDLAALDLISARTKTIEKIQNLSSGVNAGELNFYAKEYFNKNHVIPFYILVGSLSFSNLIVLFELFKKDIQLEFMNNISKKGDLYKEEDILSFSTRNNVIRILRNITHHHEPVIPFLVKKDFIDYNTKFSVIDMLKSIDGKESFVKKPNIDLCFDVTKIEKFISKKSKRIKSIIEKLK